MSAPTLTVKKRTLPSDLNQVWTVTQIEFKRNLRRKRLLALLIIVVLVSVLVLVIPQALGVGYPSDPIKGHFQFSQFFLEFIDFLAILLAVFFGGDALVSEFHGRTGYSVFPNPVKRSSIFLGKALSALFASLVILIVYYLIIAGSMAAIYGELPLELLYSFSFAVLYVSAALGLAFLISALSKTTTTAMVFTFVLFFFVLIMISSILMFARIRPEPFLTFQSGVISGFMAGHYPMDFPVDIEFPSEIGPIVIYQPRVDTGILVTFIWMIVCFMLAYYFFSRREMLG